MIKITIPATPFVVGLIEFTFTLVADSVNKLDALRRDVRAMQAWGRQKFYRQVEHTKGVTAEHCVHE